MSVRIGLRFAVLPIAAFVVSFGAGLATADINCPTGPNSLCEGNGGDNTLNGTASYDNIHARGGDDHAFGNSDADVIAGDEGADVLEGGNYSDAIRGDDGWDTIRGGNQDDWFYIGGVITGLLGNEGNDTINGNGGYDFCQGGAGQDDFENCEDRVQ